MERNSPCKLLVRACNRTGASRGNPAGGNRGSKPASRSASEPDSASLRKVEVASPPDRMKPDIGGGAMSKHSPDLPGGLGTARRNRSVEEPGRPGRAGKGNRSQTARGNQ